jgi:ubiquinone/menaquinone biosynthesis C-methylase UbiE
MSKSAKVHKENLPFCHPIIEDLPPSKAVRFIAKALLHGAQRQTMVDAGCGEGRDTLFLLHKGFLVIALDINRQNLHKLSKKVKDAGVASERFHCLNVDLVGSIPVKDATTDAVSDVWVLGSVILPHDGATGARRYLREIYRILRPGGLFVSEFETIKPRRSPKDLIRYLSKLLNGCFKIITSKATSADYCHFLKVPISHRTRPQPALFVVAQKHIEKVSAVNRG